MTPVRAPLASVLQQQQQQQQQQQAPDEMRAALDKCLVCLAKADDLLMRNPQARTKACHSD